MIKYTIKKIVNFHKNKNNTRKSYLVKFGQKQNKTSRYYEREV